MILDSSALIAILAGEAGAAELQETMLAADDLVMSAATYVEAAIVVDRRNDPVLSRRFDELLDALAVAVVPVTASQARIARAAYRDFGKGSGHPASLNFGDCFSYALAADTDDRLLFVGDDFTHTDIRPANH